MLATTIVMASGNCNGHNDIFFAGANMRENTLFRLDRGMTSAEWEIIIGSTIVLSLACGGWLTHIAMKLASIATKLDFILHHVEQTSAEVRELTRRVDHLEAHAEANQNLQTANEN